MLGDHRRVRLELADPPAVGVLELEQAVGRRVDGLVERGELSIAVMLDRLHSARPGATPLRTAASIVAGQSEATQAPAGRRSPGRSRIGHRSLRVPGRAAKVARGSRLTRDQTSSASPSRSRSASAISVDEALAADLEQVGDAARDDGQVLAAVRRLVAGERAAVEDPVRRRVEQRGEPVAEDRPVEEQVDADDRRVLERRRRLAEQARGLGRRYRDDRPRRASSSSSDSTRDSSRTSAPRRRARGRPPRRASPRAARPAGAGRWRRGSPRSAVCTVKIP